MDNAIRSSVVVLGIDLSLLLSSVSRSVCLGGLSMDLLIGDSGESFGAVESVKATSDVNSQISGKVLQVNKELTESPGLVNSSPYEEGWIMQVELSDAGDVEKLMDSDKYSKFCEEEDAKH